MQKTMVSTFYRLTFLKQNMWKYISRPISETRQLSSLYITGIMMLYYASLVACEENGCPYSSNHCH